jgi:hypothetical protein
LLIELFDILKITNKIIATSKINKKSSTQLVDEM